MTAGGEDIQAAAAELAERLPDPLEPLARLAYNYRWSWLPGAHDLFASIDRERFELCLRNPVRLLQEASTRALRRAADNELLVGRARALSRAVDEELARPASGFLNPDRPVAFLCAEYGVHVSLPIYSGGLGALAGDLLKQASDRAIPMVAVGLMYRKGYFRQWIDASGWQHEYWIDTDPQRLPAARVTEADGTPVTVEVPIYDTRVVAHIWRVDVGRVPLFLLDSDVSANGTMERWITARLYEADPAIRLAQYVLLGAGGIMALSKLGIEPDVVHLNEGHAALAPLALAMETKGGNGDAIAAARARTVFTTHTPVAAGQRRVSVGAGRRRDRGARGAAAAARVRRDRARPDRPERCRTAVRRDAGGAAAERLGQRRQPSPWRGRARDVGAAVARSRPRGRTDRTRHQWRPRPDLDRRADARVARSVARPRLARAGRGSRHVGGRARDSRRGAMGCPRPPAPRAGRVRSRAQHPESAAARRLPGVRRGRRASIRPRRADDRVRAPGRHIQAARSADARPGVDLRAARRRAPRAGRARRQGAPPRRGGQAFAPAAVRPPIRAGDRRAGRVPRRLRPRDRRRPGSRVRPVDERFRAPRSRPAAPAG